LYTTSKISSGSGAMISEMQFLAQLENYRIIFETVTYKSTTSFYIPLSNHIYNRKQDLSPCLGSHHHIPFESSAFGVFGSCWRSTFIVSSEASLIVSTETTETQDTYNNSMGQYPAFSLYEIYLQWPASCLLNFDRFSNKDRGIGCTFWDEEHPCSLVIFWLDASWDLRTWKTFSIPVKSWFLAVLIFT